MLHILQGANRQKEYIATQGRCFRLTIFGHISYSFKLHYSELVRNEICLINYKPENINAKIDL